MSLHNYMIIYPKTKLKKKKMEKKDKT